MISMLTSQSLERMGRRVCVVIVFYDTHFKQINMVNMIFCKITEVSIKYIISDNFTWVSDGFIVMCVLVVKIFAWPCGLKVFMGDDNWSMANTQGHDNTYIMMINGLLQCTTFSIIEVKHKSCLSNFFVSESLTR